MLVQHNKTNEIGSFSSEISISPSHLLINVSNEFT